MSYLLDVNALIALGFEPHEFHRRVVHWISKSAPEFATCSITELGFVRVLSQVSRYGLSVPEARSLLLRLKASRAMIITTFPGCPAGSRAPIRPLTGIC